MKVGINSKPAPRPFLGALFGGITSLLGKSWDAEIAYQQQQTQIKHDKDMAALNQKNQLEQMAIQNQYQVDQWNRENAYNDPKAVAERYREAGINPRAAFGQGSASGAGISGGLSSAPSGSNTGSSSNIMFGTDFGGFGVNVLQGMQIDQTIKRNNAEIANKDAHTSAVLIDNLTRAESNLLALENQRMDLVTKLADANLKDQEREESNKRIDELDVRISQTKESINLIRQQVDESKQRVEKSKQETRELKMANDLFESTGVRPGMSAEQALISIGSTLFDFKKSDIREFLKKFGVTPNTPVTENQIKNASQVLADEYKRLEDKDFKNNDKDAYYRYKMRIWHNLALSFK